MSVKRIVLKQGLAADRPILDLGELGYDIDTSDLVVGDGTANPLLLSGAGAGSGPGLPALVPDEQGVLIVQNADDTAYERLAQGTAGQVLSSQGPNALPSWSFLGGSVLPTLSPNEEGTLVVQNDTDDGFETIAQGTSGQVLTSQGEDALPTWVTPSGGELPPLSADKRGTLIAQNATDNGFQTIGQGSGGQVLTSQGADAVPTWAMIGGGVGTVLETVTLTSPVTSVEFTSGINGAYNSYLIRWLNLEVPLGNTSSIRIRFGWDSPTTVWEEDDFYYSGVRHVYSDGSTTHLISSDEDGPFGIALTEPSDLVSGYLHLVRPNDPAPTFFEVWHVDHVFSVYGVTVQELGGALALNNVIDAVQLNFGSTGYESGVIQLIGLS